MTRSRVLLALYAAALLVVVLSPSNTNQTDVVRWVAEHLRGSVIPWRWRTYSRLEVLANVVMVVPLGLLASLAAPRVRWPTWTAYAFLGSLSVEVIQGLLLPGRQAATSDIVANTLGMLLGALLGAAVASRRPVGSRAHPMPRE